MRHALEIENIEALRQRAGINDMELREQIRHLRVGDAVRLTLLNGGDAPSPGATIVVRITSIKGAAFRGKVASGSELPPLPELRAGLPLAFTPDHIHSIPRSQPGRRH
jgi:hypothetical protein